jgi:hypothetical protein
MPFSVIAWHNSPGRLMMMPGTLVRIVMRKGKNPYAGR